MARKALGETRDGGRNPYHDVVGWGDSCCSACSSRLVQTTRLSDEDRNNVRVGVGGEDVHTYIHNCMQEDPRYFKSAGQLRGPLWWVATHRLQGQRMTLFFGCGVAWQRLLVSCLGGDVLGSTFRECTAQKHFFFNEGRILCFPTPYLFSEMFESFPAGLTPQKVLSAGRISCWCTFLCVTVQIKAASGIG